MDIENGTDSDAKVKVSGGGPGGQIPKDGSCQEEKEWHLGPKQKLTLPEFDAGCVIKVSVEMEVGRHKVPTRRTAVKGLKLTKGSGGEYRVTTVRNGSTST